MKKNLKTQTTSNNSKGAAQGKKHHNNELRTTVLKQWYESNQKRFAELIESSKKGEITSAEFDERHARLLQELENALKNAGVKGQRCSITGETFYSYGNNAYPFSGRCSDYANLRYVIPARFMGFTPSTIKRIGGNKATARMMEKHLYNELPTYNECNS